MSEEANKTETAESQTVQPAEVVAPDEDEINVTESKPAESTGTTRTRLADIEREVERAFERVFKSGWLSPSQWDLPTLSRLRDTFEGKSPRVNVIERDNELVVVAELPGVAKSEVEVSMGNDSITIKASTNKETTEEDGAYRRREISQGDFSRVVSLPTAIDGSKAKAVFSDGLLTVIVPKVEESGRHTVPID